MIPTDLEKNFTSFLSYNAPILTGLDTPACTFSPENHEIYMVLLEHIQHMLDKKIASSRNLKTIDS